MTPSRRRSPAVLFAALSVCVLAAVLASCRSGATDPFAELRGVTQFVPNASFEELEGENPKDWTPRAWQRGGAAFAVASSGKTGERSVSIASETDKGVDASWVAIVPVRPYSRYRLSGFIKAENVAAGTGRGAQINVNGEEAWRTAPLTGTLDWTEVAVEFEAGAVDAVEVTCLLGGWGRSTGQAWFDDVTLTRLSGRELGRPAVTIDGTKTGAPVSKYIYGQFIEHLGRCIYQGLWAELLEDRKFFWPVGDAESPWKPVGEPAAVTMDKVRPFTGAHTPRVALDGAGPRGLVQGDLALVERRDYVGRVVLAGDAGAAPVTVSVVWGEAPEARWSLTVDALGRDFRTVPFAFKAGASTAAARLEIVSSGRGSFRVGTASIMPADNIDGFRPEVVALLKELDSPVYRWPGGNFVSGYDWRDGIGDRDRRPPRTNPAWTGVEHNDFGMHEFIRFCRMLKTEPWITVNTGFGDAHSAAAQLEYCNGPADSHWGGRRAANGAPQPWGVRYWGIGNEMWGNWQLGHMRLEHYVIKQNWVVDTMRQVDAKIICIASGDTGNDWSAGLLKGCSNHMDFIAEHFYTQERPGLAAHVRQVPDRIRQKAEWHRRARAEIPQLQGKDIRIAMTEWNYWYGPHIFGELGTRYFLKDALGIAAGLHEYARQSDIVGSAFYAQTVNVIGAIKTSRRNAAMETTGLVLKLYRQHFGEIPAATTTGGTLDAQAMWTADRKKLTLAVVNPNLTAMEVPLAVTGAKLKGTGTRWQIAGTDPQAYNDPDTAPNRVTIEESPLKGPVGRLTLAPCSLTLIAFDVE